MMNTHIALGMACALLLFSCTLDRERPLTTDESSQADATGLIETGAIERTVTLTESFEFVLSDADDIILSFEIIPLDIGHASRVHPGVSTDILDNSTYGYPDPLQVDELIGGDHHWSNQENHVLATSVGQGGQFEGAGPRYLGFRIKRDGSYQYGWVLVHNHDKTENTRLDVIAYGINRASGNPILAGQTE